MSWVALRTLTGDRNKYLGIIFGVAFASLLMAHQVSIFCGRQATLPQEIPRSKKLRHLASSPALVVRLYSIISVD